MFGLSPWKAKTEFDVTLRPNRVTAQAFGRDILLAICAAQYGENRVAATHDGVGGCCHSGMVREHQTRNLEIPGSMLRIAPE
jgi:hypothetical protein